MNPRRGNTQKKQTMQQELSEFITKQKLKPKDKSESMKGYLTTLLNNPNNFDDEQKATLIAS